VTNALPGSEAGAKLKDSAKTAAKQLSPDSPVAQPASTDDERICVDWEPSETCWDCARTAL